MAAENIRKSPVSLDRACYTTAAINQNEIWKSDNILTNYAPTLAIQIAVTICASSIIHRILKPLHLPRLIAEVLTGFILSPPLLGSTPLGRELLPRGGILIIETYANMGLVFYVFVSGLEMNLDNIQQVRKMATSIAVAGIIIPLVIGMGLFSIIQKFYDKSVMIGPYRYYEDDRFTAKAYIFWSLALTVTGFPVLARILADLKLLYTGLGRAALTAAMIGDTYGWVMFIISIPFANNDAGGILSVMSTILFILFSIFVLRPLVTPLIESKTDHDTWHDSHLLFVLLGVFVCSYITDMLGTHSIVGAFVFGLILPQGTFSNLVMEKVDEFVSGAISPIFFLRSGLTVNLSMVASQKYWPLMALIVLLLCIPKVLSTLIATFFYGIPTRDGVGIGLLLNAKGVLALIILNMAWDRKILSVVTFSIMVCAVLIMTITVPLFINAIYKPRKRFESYRLRTIQKLRVDAELRILVCVHNARQAAGMVNILETANATRVSPLHVFGVHLVELTGRATALLAAHMEQTTNVGAQNLTQSQAESESISHTFDALSEACNAVRVDTLHAVSNYETIHEDISNIAEQNRTALILLPFHKQLDAEGGLETTNVAYGDINQNVLQHAPCSVGIFVDRGLGSLSRNKLRILMLFFGGPDDREALAVAWRMAGRPGIQLSMVRIFLFGEAAEEDMFAHAETPWLSSVIMDGERQKLLNEEYVSSFRLKAVNNDESISYSEKQVQSAEEITSALRELDKNDYDLYIVGRGDGRNSLAFSNFMEWCDNPELGVIGDIVASNTFGSRSSLLVVQQYGPGGVMLGTQTRHPGQLPTKSEGSETLVVNSA